GTLEWQREVPASSTTGRWTCWPATVSSAPRGGNSRWRCSTSAVAGWGTDRRHASRAVRGTGKQSTSAQQHAAEPARNHVRVSPDHTISGYRHTGLMGFIINLIAIIIAIASVVAALGHLGYLAMLNNAAKQRAGGGPITEYVRGRWPVAGGTAAASLIAWLFTMGGSTMDIIAIL